MALWQFAFTPVPAKDAKISGIDAINLSCDVLERIDLGLTPSEQFDLFSALGLLLPEKASWSDSLRIWGDEKADDVQVFFDGARIELIEFRLDVSNLSIALIGEFCALARKFAWVFATSDGAVILPTREAVVRAVIRSPANRFVRDPKGYLEQASRADIRPE